MIPETREQAFEVLELPKSANKTEIKQAYRKLIIQWHPDKRVNKSESEEEKKIATEKSKEIMAAYQILTGKSKKEIDEELDEIFNSISKLAKILFYGVHLSEKEIDLFEALRNKDLDQTKILLKQVQNINAGRFPRKSILHYIVENSCNNPQSGWTELLEEVLSKYGNLINLNVISFPEGPPLNLACGLGDLDIVNILLKYGAELDASILYCVLMDNKNDIAKVLLEHGTKIDANPKVEKLIIGNITKYSRSTVEMLLPYMSNRQKSRMLKSIDYSDHEKIDHNIELKELLLEAGADPEFCDKTERRWIIIALASLLFGAIGATLVTMGIIPEITAIGVIATAVLSGIAGAVIGGIAGDIAYSVLKPSDDKCLSKPQKSVVNSPKSQNKVQSQISDQKPKITIPQHLVEENPKESVSKANTNITLTENSLNNGSETTTTDQQRALSQNFVANEPKAVGELKFVGEKLLLVTTSDQFAKCKDYRNTQSANPDELLMFIKCGAKEYRIVGNSTEGSILIKSILRKSEGDKYINGNILLCVAEEIRSVKKMLGLKNGVTEVKVESISNEPFGVKTLTTTAHQTVSNTTIDQPTSSSAPSEHKETLVNAHEEKDEHNNAASNRKVQPVEVDAEVKILMGDLLSEVSAQDSDKIEKTPISKRSERESFPSGSGEEEFYDTEDKQLSSITSDDDTLEFQDAIDDGITQPCLITSDMVVEQVETQNTVGRVLNKPQGNNIVINGIVIPEGAKLKCFPELSNFLSKASLEREKLFCKVVPNSSLFQSKEERLAINGQSIDAQ